MMLSRLAENLYWYSRYLERAEGLARLINVNAHLNMDLPGRLAPGWEPLIRITGHSTLFAEQYGDALVEKTVVKFLLSDARNPASIRSSLERARENLRSARDLLPREIWERMNTLYLDAEAQFKSALSKRKRQDWLDQLTLGCQQMTGMLMGTMSQDHAYDFILIGRYLERADMITRIIDVRAFDLLPDELEELPPFESIQWMGVLKSLSAYQMYRRHVRVRVSGPEVLAFLLKNPQFPRSVLFCLRWLASRLAALPGNDDQALRRVVELMRKVQQAPSERLKDQSLSQFLDQVQIDLAEVDRLISQTWLPAE
ncbi:MAG: alpha-E domain-containing protein [Pseudomonadota bacterium]